MANYKFARLAAYTITSWLAVIATAASLNALIKYVPSSFSNSQPPPRLVKLGIGVDFLERFLT